MDRSWMNESRMSPTHEEDVEEFLQFASERSQPDGDEIFFLSLYKLFERKTTNIGWHTGASVVWWD